MTLLFIYLCFLEEKESKIFSEGCDQNKAVRIGFMLDHISRFFHSVDKPGVWSFPACRKPSSLLSVPCAAFAWLPALAHVVLQSSFLSRNKGLLGFPAPQRRPRGQTRLEGSSIFLNYLHLNGATWACASNPFLGIKQCPAWHLACISRKLDSVLLRTWSQWCDV